MTVDAFAAQQAEDPLGHKNVSSSAAKKVMDWFRRKSLAKDTLVNLKTNGAKSDSVGSFARVSTSQARGAPRMADSTANLAMSSSSSITNTAEGTPNITVTEAAPGPESAPIKWSTPNNLVASGRIPLGPATNKINLPVPASMSTASLLPPSRTGPMPIPSRSKSQHPIETLSTAATTTTIAATTTAAFVASTQRPVVKATDDAKMRVHTGLVDQSALSSLPPAEVLAEVLRVLQGMGIDVKKENDFRLRCTRVRRRKAGATTGLGLGSVMSVGSGMSPFNLMNSASTGRVCADFCSELSIRLIDVRQTDSRGLPMPSSPSAGLLSSGGLKGMLLRRGSSMSSPHPSPMVRSESEPFGSPSASSTGFASPTLGPEPLYGEHSYVFLVRFLTRASRLMESYLAWIAGTKSNLSSSCAGSRIFLDCTCSILSD